MEMGYKVVDNVINDVVNKDPVIQVEGEEPRSPYPARCFKNIKLFYPKGGSFPPAWPRGGGALGCTGSVRAL
eukprot:scaffold241838_cov40-Tisochrysis_lutea.AAC.1